MSNTLLKFILDDKIVEIDFNIEKKYNPTTSLLQYLRSLPNHKGTKEGCAEGDCGACTVVLVEINSEKKLSFNAIDSCLVFLPMIHGKKLITVENIGKSDDLHPVQQAMIEKDGSQCGYCSPGIVMSLFSYFKNEKQFNKEIVKDYIVGNLCRCTGYKSIYSAAQNIDYVAKDFFDINYKNIINELETINMENILSIKTDVQSYLKPFSLNDALDLRDKFPEALIVSGNILIINTSSTFV